MIRCLPHLYKVTVVCIQLLIWIYIFNKKMTKEAMPVEHIQALIDLLFLEC